MFETTLRRCCRSGAPILSSLTAVERVPTEEETEKREIQLRKLVLMNKEKRATALAELAAQDAERERQREAEENARRRRAATGVYLCLLELKQPVQAAEAARARLGMCKTEEERHQVRRYGRVKS